MSSQWPCLLYTSIIFLIIGVAYYIIRQRLRLQRERTDRYLLLAEEANAQ